ncbi:MAG: preprotein translocase subunit SecG, partial [Pirellulaceae bacterium]
MTNMIFLAEDNSFLWSMWQYFLAITLFCMALFLIVLILIQRGRGGGLSGAFGGAGGQSAFGAKAGDVFTRITMVTAFIWIVLSVFALRAFTNKVAKPLGAEEPGISAPKDGIGTLPNDSVVPESTDGTDPPAEGTDPPAEGTDPPAEGTDPPAEGTDPPAEGTDPPAEGTDPPAEGTDPPAEGTDPPAEG